MYPYLPRDVSRTQYPEKSHRRGDAFDRLTGGGPLQRALKSDLGALRPRMTTPFFADCKALFRQTKLTAWLSRFVPPRIDRCAYSQLIYAVCLSFLPVVPTTAALAAAPERNTTSDDSGEEEEKEDTVNDDPRFVDAAFAIFSLYIFHETNPLPLPQSINGLQNFTMGIKPELDDTLPRRYFRPYIRIDERTFRQFLYWREQGRAVGDRGKDVVAVLERLWGQLDFCSYKGPRSLEGMAGSPDYPHTQKSAILAKLPKKQKKKQQKVVSSTDVNTQVQDDATRNLRHATRSRQTGLGESIHEPATGNDETDDALSESSKALSESIKDYLACRKSVRFSNPLDERHKRKIERVRAAIQPLYTEGPNSTQALVARVQEPPSVTTTMLQHKPRIVTFSVGESVETGDSKHAAEAREKDTSVASSVAPDSIAGTEDVDQDAYELVLPLGTPAALRQSLEHAIAGILTSYPLVGLPTVHLTNDQDDLSTLGPSVAPDTNSRHPRPAAGSLSLSGRKALQTLLDEAETCTAGSTTGTVHSRVGQDALQVLLEEARQSSSTASVQSNAGQEALQALLAQVEAGADAASVVSHMGRDALQNLLRQAEIDQTDDGKPPAVPPHISQRVCKGQDFLSADGAMDDGDFLDNMSDFSGDDEDDFSVAVSSLGRKAIKELVGATPTERRAAKARPRKRRRRQYSKSEADIDEDDEEISTRGQDALMHLLSQADHHDD